MENAVKALLIAAGVLIGVMILSLGASLYASLSEYVELTQLEIVNKEIQQFNEQFTKYINCEDTPGAIPEFTLTIQDIVTAANTAYENNLENGTQVTINMPGYINNLESSINLNSAEVLRKGLGKEYICKYRDVQINPDTGRVFQVDFYEYTGP